MKNKDFSQSDSNKINSLNWNSHLTELVKQLQLYGDINEIELLRFAQYYFTDKIELTRWLQANIEETIEAFQELIQAEKEVGLKKPVVSSSFTSYTSYKEQQEAVISYEEYQKACLEMVRKLPNGVEMARLYQAGKLERDLNAKTPAFLTSETYERDFSYKQYEKGFLETLGKSSTFAKDVPSIKRFLEKEATNHEQEEKEGQHLERAPGYKGIEDIWWSRLREKLIRWYVQH